MKAILIFLASAACTVAHADVNFHVKEYLLNVAVEVHMTGQIGARDDAELESGLAAARQFAAARKKSIDGPHFVLSSVGGDVSAGAAIGRWARSKQAHAVVEDECSSACVLILAGAVDRRIRSGGKVGIHRVHFSGLNPASSYGQVREKMAAADEFLLAYFREMDIPPTLLEEMKSIPPNRVRYLSSAELQRYRLLGSDPVYQETSDLREAGRYGVSRQEYYRRKARADTVCRQGTVVELDCWEEVLRGKK